MNRYWESQDEHQIEAEAELAYLLRDEITCARNWVIKEGRTHATSFIREMNLYLRRPRQLPSHVAVLTPRQELAILDYYRRATRVGEIWTETAGTVVQRLERLRARRKESAAIAARYRTSASG